MIVNLVAKIFMEKNKCLICGKDTFQKWNLLQDAAEYYGRIYRSLQKEQEGKSWIKVSVCDDCQGNNDRILPNNFKGSNVYILDEKIRKIFRSKI